MKGMCDHITVEVLSPDLVNALGYEMDGYNGFKQ